MNRANIEQTITLLTREYGVQNCQPDGSPLDVLVETILSQNTSDTNSGRAFRSLRTTFPNWEAVAEAPASKIAESIRVGGLDKIKSNRIKQVLAEIKRMRGQLELDFLNELPIDEARAWLRRLPGVGAKTANCVLLFALCTPALPVDTHILRVSKRLGFIDFKVSAEKAHTLLEAMVPSEKVYAFHVLMIEHGRRICKAQRPRCTECVLGSFCPSYEGFVGDKNVLQG
ncbi:MAG: endonuclease III [Chloroflexi bacterium]|nr:endonuclease III [Chloroflexota bacterium]